MSEKVDYRKFHDIKRTVAAAGLPSYAFIDRESKGGEGATIYRKKEVFVYLKDRQVFWISPSEKVVCIPLSEVQKLYLCTGASDSEVICHISGRWAKQVVFGDHSYRNGGYDIAEVLRVQFRTFIEEIQRALIDHGFEHNVIFEARGASSRAVGCLTAFTFFGLGPILMTALMVYWPESQNQSEIEDRAWLFTAVILLACVGVIVLSLYLGRVLSPRISFEQAKTPGLMFELADAAITASCDRYASAQRFRNYRIPDFKKGVYQYIDAKGVQCRYQITDTEIVFKMWKDGENSQEDRYRLEDIGRVNLNQQRLNFYVISITFHDGITWRINTEDFNASVGNQRAHGETQRARFHQWIDYLHEQLQDHKRTGGIEYTSGSSTGYELARAGKVVFNVLVFGTIVFVMLFGEWSFQLLFTVISLGLVAVVTNLGFSAFNTKEPTQPYSPASMPWRHVPGEGAAMR